MPTSSDHRPCRCPDYLRTLHIGEAHCHRLGGMAAHCAVCRGCKACRLYDEGELPEGARNLAGAAARQPQRVRLRQQARS